MEEIKESQVVPCDGTQTKDWHAWIDKMPPTPDALHVMGEVLVSNPGVDPILVPKEPQGINPNILLLDLILIQKPGIWPEMLVWKQVRYNKEGNFHYDRINVFCGDSVIADIEVKVVS